MIFVDTGSFLGRYLPSDQHHAQASEAWRALAAAKEKFVTSNFVLDETFTLLARRSSYRFAAKIARNLYDSNVLEILRPDAYEERLAIDLFEKYADQEVSFTDCISFALMRSRNIQRVLTFDRHFRFAGFTCIP